MVRDCKTVHEKRRDHKCANSLFGDKGNMMRHCKTVHGKRQDHKCPHCSNRFVAAWVMREHCRTVHEKRRDHACPYCPGVASRRSST